MCFPCLYSKRFGFITHTQRVLPPFQSLHSLLLYRASKQRMSPDRPLKIKLLPLDPRSARPAFVVTIDQAIRQVYPQHPPIQYTSRLPLSMVMCVLPLWWIAKMSFYGTLGGLSKLSHYRRNTRVIEHSCRAGERVI